MSRVPLRFVFLLVLGFSSCREGSDNAGTTVTLAPNPFGSEGCNGTDLAFGTAPELILSDPILGPMSAIAAIQGDEILYLSGADGSLYELDLTGGGPAPVVTPIVDASVFDMLLASKGIGLPAQLSGLAVYQPSLLAAIDHTSNTVLRVNLQTLDVDILAGRPSVDPNSADGPGTSARFAFSSSMGIVPPTELCPSDDGRIFVADWGSHQIRVIFLGSSVSQVFTIAGSGAPGDQDGNLADAVFDTPTGLVMSCANRLLVTELGGNGLSTGHRLRSLSIGGPDPLNPGFLGTAETLVGDGTEASGMGSAARPSSPVATMDGEIYWVDATLGILRRLQPGAADADCPYFVDCDAAAAAQGSFANDGTFSLTIGGSGTLYVLEWTGAVGNLYRIVP